MGANNEKANKDANVERRAEYARRREARQVQVEALARTDRTYGNARLAAFALFVVMAWFAFYDHLFHGAWLFVPVGVYLVLASRHDRVIQDRKRAERAVQFYDSGLRRLNHKWQGSGNSGARFLRAEHPYAIDLDIFGRASLFELLCAARTQAGETFLADWLRAPASPAVIRMRQQAAMELQDRLDLREDLAVLGDQVKGAIRSDVLVEWGEQPAIRFASWERSLMIQLAIATTGAGLWWATGHGPQAFTLLFVMEQLWWMGLRRRLSRITGEVEKPLKDLALFARLLARIEREPVRSPRLKELSLLLEAVPPAAGNRGAIPPPSARISRLERLVELLQIPGNPLLKLLDIVCQFSTFVTFAIEGWRQANGPHIVQWIQAVGEFEALASLAGYAYENPEAIFPEIIEVEATLGAEQSLEQSPTDEILLDTVAMAHPLLPANVAVPNDLRFSRSQRLYIVSGSNMSGKSTLMRALGVNVVLALAGAPVRARYLRLVPLRIGASIRTQDSLEAGISRFYAEILRLRQIVDLTKPASSTYDAHAPLLFLLDEILHGTNSHDRRVGAEAVIRALLSHNALGLVSTHDLALARIAEDPDLPATNVHLQDQLTDGKMTFDYHLRPGVVTRSNAIELMRAVGLDV